jgi:hypothetical protein
MRRRVLRKIKLKTRMSLNKRPIKRLKRVCMTERRLMQLMLHRSLMPTMNAPRISKTRR